VPKIPLKSQIEANRATWTQQASGTRGSWKWQGSNDDSNWTDISSVFVMPNTNGFVDNSMSINTQAYQYYRMLGDSGILEFYYHNEIDFDICQGSPLIFADEDGDTRVQVEESADEDKLRFDTAGSERMIIDNAGNIGIGTTSPGEKLQVVGVIESTSGGIKFPDGTTQTTAASGGGGITWSTVTVNTNIAVNTGYIVNSSNNIALTLPATCDVGDRVRIVGIGSGGWRVLQQNAGHKIHNTDMGVSVTGSGGGIKSLTPNGKDSIEMMCVVTNDEWSVLSQTGTVGGLAVSEDLLPTGVVSGDVLNHLKFNGNVTDGGANGGSTTEAGTLTYQAGYSGQSASGFSLSNAAAITRVTLSSYTGSGLTFSAWVKGTDATVNSSDHRVAQNIFGDTTGATWYGSGISGGKVTARAQSNIQSTATVNDGNWHHILFSYTYSGSVWTIQIYIDGTADGSGNLEAGGNPHFGVNAIGRTNVSYGQFFGYEIDNVVILSKSVTSAQAQEFAGTAPPNNTIVVNGSGRKWSNGTFAVSCSEYISPSAGFAYSGETGDGQYTIDPDGVGGNAEYDVYCDMTTQGGGWTRYNPVASTAVEAAIFTITDGDDLSESSPINITVGTDATGSHMNSTASLPVASAYLIKADHISTGGGAGPNFRFGFSPDGTPANYSANYLETVAHTTTDRDVVFDKTAKTISTYVSGSLSGTPTSVSETTDTWYFWLASWADTSPAWNYDFKFYYK
jgi:hypothetical protein